MWLWACSFVDWTGLCSAPLSSFTMHESCATPLGTLPWHEALIKMGIGEPALQPLRHVNSPTPGNNIENYTLILNTKDHNPVTDYFKQLAI